MLKFGFDMGTNSIGWAVVNIANEQILKMGVVAFHDGRLSPSMGNVMGDSMATTRREASAMRKMRERRIYRTNTTAKLLHKFLKTEIPVNINPYRARARSAERMVSPAVLARALWHIGKRRGFLSNRKAGNAKDGVTKTAINRLNSILNGQTLGQYMHQNNHKRFKPETKGSKIEYEFYPTRQLYIDEFNAIKAKNYNHLADAQWDEIYNSIFYQRPLQVQPKGQCTFYEQYERASKHLPIAHEFRIIQELDNLRVIDGTLSRALTDAEYIFIYNELQKTKKCAFNTLRKKLGLTNQKFNLESETRKELMGNDTKIDMVKIFNKYIMQWEEIDQQTQNDLITNAFDVQTDEEFFEKYQHAFDSALLADILDWAEGLSPRYGNVSYQLMADILPIMKNEKLPYHNAITKLNLHHSNMDNDGVILHPLPYYGAVLSKHTTNKKPDFAQKQYTNDNARAEAEFGKIGNPTVHVALNQLRKLVNNLVNQFGRPEFINIEFSRDLKNSKDKVNDIQKEINKFQRAKEKLIKDYPDYLSNESSANDLDRFRFWLELPSNGLTHTCLYCGNPISAGQLLNGEAEIEHILPRSWSSDNTRANKTIAHTQCNRTKGNNTPFEKFGNAVAIRADECENLPASKKWRFLENARDIWRKKVEKQLTPDEIEKFGNVESAWQARQLIDTQYIARVARLYLAKTTGDIYRVIPVSYQLSSQMRHRWGLNTYLPGGNTKNRNDHRHHALDALVVALLDLADTQLANKLSGRGFDFDGVNKHLPPYIPHQLPEQLQNIVVHTKPNHSLNGSMFEETAYGTKLRKRERAGYNTITTKAIEAIVKDKLKKNKPISDDGTERKERQKIRDKTCENTIDAVIADHFHAGETKIVNILRNQYKIKRVRILNKTEVVPIKSAKDKDSKPFKALARDEFACVVIWKTPKMNNKRKFTGKFEYIGRFLGYDNAPLLKTNPQKIFHEVSDDDNAIAKPHNAAKHVMTLFKNDMVAMQYDPKLANDLEKYAGEGVIVKPQTINGQEWLLCRIKGFSVTNNCIMLEYQLASNSQQFTKGIAVLANLYKIHKCRVAVDGTVHILPNRAI